MTDPETFGPGRDRESGQRPAFVRRIAPAVWLCALAAGVLLVAAAAGPQPENIPQDQTAAAAAAPALPPSGCRSCHVQTDSANGHESAVRVTCTQCHGGNDTVTLSPGTAPGSRAYNKVKSKAHVAPLHSSWWKTSGNPEESYTRWTRESPEFVRFVNPGDLRVAKEACGTEKCHPKEVRDVSTSMMRHGAMLWGSALYNNGAYPFKNVAFGEFVTRDGKAGVARTIPAPTAEDTRTKGILPWLSPLPHWEVTSPGNILRVFERGGKPVPEIGNPAAADEEEGRPDDKLSIRGFGTLLRTDPVFLGLQKTRLLDPTLNGLGTNDHPGDYRSSGCTACHMIYANDRDPSHSAQYASAGHLGQSSSVDTTIPREERGHPIKHALTLSIPSSQCITCHVHPGTNVVNAYYGTMWWDNETDGKWMYPAKSPHRSAAEIDRIQRSNPEGSAVRGLWGDPRFLEQVASLNPKLQQTQFADFNGHGWVFRNVYWHDDKGTLLDAEGKALAFDDPKKFDKAVHLKDIHLEKGMHCVDCHFVGDSHGDGKIYAETRAAAKIRCVDCHGAYDKVAALTLSDGTDLTSLPTAFGPRFSKRRGKIYQQSALDASVKWEIVQTLDTITPGNEHYNERSRMAKTMQRDGATWGAFPSEASKLAHASNRVSCQTCHTAWVTSCFGCHLPMSANQKKPNLHAEGTNSRNWTQYSFQTLRDDVFMLGHDSTVHGNDVAPIRSSCAVLVDSQNVNREWLYTQQQTVSAGGLAGTAFSPFYSHAIRGGLQTKTCTDCHLSRENNNNAKMAQLLMLGTNFYNFIGRYAWVAEGRSGFSAVAVTERDEPQAVIGSSLHSLAYPERYKSFEAGGRRLHDAHRHRGHDIVSLQARGEYLYTASGSDGLVVYDIANVDNKGFSQRIQTAPVSPLGQRFYVGSKDATAVASPSTMALDPTRQQFAVNEEPKVHPMYGYIYFTDRKEGLILVGAATLLDGDPTNNFLKRAATFNPEGKLTGATGITIVGTYAYVSTDHGLEVVSLDKVPRLRIVAEIGSPDLNHPRSVATQFRYAFVCDADGVKVLDITDLAAPRMTGTVIGLPEANSIYLARTYAYVAAGKKGLVVLDIQDPERPRLDQVFDANGTLNDTRDVKLGMTNNSLYAYVADGKNGMKVLQLASPDMTPGIFGFSPRPTPKLIATYATSGPALAISKGLDRDRAVDESGNQLAVFGRRGARPFDQSEMYRMYIRGDKVWTVSGGAPGPPAEFKTP